MGRQALFMVNITPTSYVHAHIYVCAYASIIINIHFHKAGERVF
jgi:hypothetical protein